MGLIEVAKLGSLQEWDEILKEGADPNELDSYGTNALSWMLKMDHVGLFQHAIQSGADPTSPYRTPGNVIFDAFSQNRTPFIEVIIQTASIWKNSPNLLTRDKEGNTIFHLSVMESNEPLWEVIHEWINDEIFSLRNESGRTVFLEAVVENRIEILSFLLKTFTKAKDQIDSEGKNALHLASERNLDEVCSILLEDDIFQLESKDNFGNTALFLSASADGVESMKELLYAGANPFVWGENEESITRLLDREKFGHCLKTWKDFVIQKAILGDIYPLRNEMIQYIKLEKPFKPEELAKAKLIDLI
ncbi:ankyrin repeat domain-containing protein [Leptospira bouyouniensis]|uniref:Ankyrin repeat domain-containing protein n=1 Tax=Leptospira bouyouniensis TaxID=2484911 RepID=A0ABY2L617_9LEPT|nr:ankyrin repeat domain-containing protein [Leptospira bouyouniensis]TGK51238.1 ankyrin repeat domain-containing protein [Leptospira bouyouniensis]TGM87803.1 ankyrin repeat domain-containing protein [Leptospira bouyouniensis]